MSPVDPTTGGGERPLRATAGWNRLNRALNVTLPRKLKRAEAARRRIAKLR